MITNFFDTDKEALSFFNTKLRSLKKEKYKIDKIVFEDLQRIRNYRDKLTIYTCQLIYQWGNTYKTYISLDKQIRKFRYYIQLIKKPKTTLRLGPAKNYSMQELFQSYDIKKRHKQYFCPFHDDNRSPNMSINSRTNKFKCFSCGESGSTIDFVMKYEKIPFKEAVRMINSKGGV